MLLELSIHDFAIIDEMRLGFEPGFNALTGETGAGKSILIDALGAVLGDRVGSDVVRTGTRAARVEATFEVSALMERPEAAAVFAESGVEPEDGLVILSREVSASGRSSARVNGRATTAGSLARVGGLLVDVHGQSDHLSLLRPAEQLEMLDRYAAVLTAREALGGLVREWRGLQARIAAIAGNARARAQREDYLRFVVGEIEGAELRPEEEEELLGERRILGNAEQLATEAAAAHALLVGEDEAVGGEAVVPALAALRRAGDHLRVVAGVDPGMGSVAERLAEVVFLAEDVVAEVRGYRDRVEADPTRLAAVEERLAELKALKRKYGATIEEVIAAGEAAARELAEMTGEEGDLDALRSRAGQLGSEVGRRAAELSGRRAEAGERLARAVERAIGELNMGRARFAVAMTQIADEGGVPFGDGRSVAVEATGADRAEFQIAPNAGEALKPLGRVASGGETARLMLALKSILSEADATPTLVFDEVDVGVGGRSGQVVGEKLWRLADGHQVLVITHLPQIAAFAGAHYRIAKGERAGRVVSRVDPLTAEERIEELAAMFDGVPITEAARSSAREMVARVEAWKARAGDASRRSGRAAPWQRDLAAAGSAAD